MYTTANLPPATLYAVFLLCRFAAAATNHTYYASESLFSPYDPSRHYVHVRYFEVGTVDFEHVRAPLIISCWLLVAGVGKMLIHASTRFSHYVPESCVLVLLGIFVGAVLNFWFGDIEASHHMNPDTFFLFMLPPIVINAAYFVSNRLFLKNFVPIVMLALVGTILNVLSLSLTLQVIGWTNVYDIQLDPLHLYLFATLISAIDPVAVLAVFESVPVNEVLYIIVFGESLLNDAATVGFYHMFEEYIETSQYDRFSFDLSNIGKGFLKFTSASLGGSMIGFVWGLCIAFMTKYTLLAESMEPLIVLVMLYITYLCAELFHLSGILAVVVGAIVMKLFVSLNITERSSSTLEHVMNILSTSSEAAVFLLLGVATVHNHHNWNLAFILFSLIFCLIYRFIWVFLLMHLANKFRKIKVPSVDTAVIAYGGVRGGVAFALAVMIDPHYVPQQQMFLTTTIVIIYFTTFIQGTTVRSLVRKLDVSPSTENILDITNESHQTKSINSNLMNALYLKSRGIYNQFIVPLFLRKQASMPDKHSIQLTSYGDAHKNDENTPNCRIEKDGDDSNGMNYCIFCGPKHVAQPFTVCKACHEIRNSERFSVSSNNTLYFMKNSRLFRKRSSSLS